MIERGIASWTAILAVREAERLVRREADQAASRLKMIKVMGALAKGFLAAGFLTLCFLPALTVLALVVTGIFLAR